LKKPNKLGGTQKLPTSLEGWFTENFALGSRAFGRRYNRGINAYE